MEQSVQQDQPEAQVRLGLPEQPDHAVLKHSPLPALLILQEPLKMLSQSIADTTGNITSTSTTSLLLQPGFYQISLEVSTILSTAGYMQITPAYNGAPHIEFGIYSRTGSPQNTAEGSSHFIIEVTQATPFTVNYNSNVANTDGQLTLVIVKLER